jgi:hypothetical protein
MGASRVGEDAMMGYGAGAIVSKSESAPSSLDSDATDDPLAAAVLDDMMATLGIDNKKAKERKRAEHKYQKKGKKGKTSSQVQGIWREHHRRWARLLGG